EHNTGSKGCATYAGAWRAARGCREEQGPAARTPEESCAARDSDTAICSPCWPRWSNTVAFPGQVGVPPGVERHPVRARVAEGALTGRRALGPGVAAVGAARPPVPMSPSGCLRSSATPDNLLSPGTREATAPASCSLGPRFQSGRGEKGPVKLKQAA